MARVLLAWEYGLGIGYVDRLVQLAEALAQDGHEPVFCLRDLVGTADLLKNKPWMVMQAPLSIGVLHPTQPNFSPGSYGDLLAVNNFADEEQLFRLVYAWHMLFLALQPQVIVGEYAPACAVAAYGRIPYIAMGHGYITPPNDKPEFPIFNPTVQRAPGVERILDTIHRVQQRLVSALPRSAPEAIGGVAQFVTAFRETDPYADLRTQRHAGPLETLEPPPPPPAERCFYAYLSATHPLIGMYVQALADAGIRGMVYVKRLTPELKQYLGERGVGVYDGPPPLHPTVRAASVIVHHGGIATLTAAMGAGRPQILLPEVADQTVSANTIDKLGISVNGRRRLANAAQISRATRELGDPAGEACQRAQAIANDIHGRGEYGSLSPILTTIRGLVAG
jgi:hypothetical protein